MHNTIYIDIFRIFKKSLHKGYGNSSTNFFTGCRLYADKPNKKKLRKKKFKFLNGQDFKVLIKFLKGNLLILCYLYYLSR